MQATVDPGELRLDELLVEVVHGPLDASGALDGARMNRVTMTGDGDGVFVADFTPTGAGPWGATVRVLPTHPVLSSVFEPGLVALG